MLHFKITFEELQSYMHFIHIQFFLFFDARICIYEYFSVFIKILIQRARDGIFHIFPPENIFIRLDESKFPRFFS